MIQKIYSACRDRTYKSQPLQRFDGDRIAVVIVRRGNRSVLRGSARYIVRSTGNELEIKVRDDEIGNPSVVLQERLWHGRLTPDKEFGCDFQLRLEVDTSPTCG